ncbi:extracellular elastinolytic metalloproteinase [Gammaproteobacteria bacterium]
MLIRGSSPPLGSLATTTLVFPMKKNLFVLLALTSALVIESSVALGATPVVRPNYDASLEGSATSTVPSVTNGVLPRSAWVQSRRSSRNQAAGYPSNDDEQLGTTTFLWAAPNTDPSPPPAMAAKQQERAAQVERTTREFLGHNGVRLGLSKHTIATARLRELHDTKRGPLIARYQQMHGGVEVFGRHLNVMLDRELRPVAASGYFAPDDSSDGTAVASALADGGFRQSPQQAIASAVADLGGEIDPATLESLGERDDYTLFRVTRQTGAYRLTDTARSKRVYFPLDGRLVPAWYLDVSLEKRGQAGRLSYGYVVAAEDGRILFRNNHIDRAAFSYRVFADAISPGMPFDTPFGNDIVPLTALDPNLTLPRISAETNLVTLESGPIATGDPWLPSGATTTVGNNVDAYVDLGGGNGRQPKSGDFRAKVTSLRSFDYSVVADTDPTTPTARNGGIVNLFYVNNFLHDWWYGNGFDEAAGNAQTNNYGRGGLGGDPILAEGQDYSGFDNANMDTPADGRSPRMQMFLWSGSTAANATLSAVGLGSLVTNVADFGAMQFDLDGQVVTVTPADACTDLTNTTNVSGNIAFIDRGNCFFVDKVANVQKAGAIGAIIVNNSDDGTAPSMTGTNEAVTIPVLSTSFADGARIKNEIARGPLTVTMHRAPSANRDGGIDNGIIAHEWFHYVSNRLVGNGDGLSNKQGGALGEGWSDVSALLLEARPEDATVAGNANFQGAYPFGIYTMPSPYFGIRRAPYSTNPAVFPMTFKHITDGVTLPSTAPLAPGGDNSEEHSAGEIWANTLWDFYVSLINDARYTFREAQDRMKDYIIAGLKMTPNAPTFLEARDALLAAVKATDRADFELATKSFAKYGMGVGAIAPSRNSQDNSGLVESFVALRASYEVVETTLDTTYLTSTAGYCDADGVLDAGETALLTLRIRNSGNQPLPRRLTAQVTSTADVSFGNSGRIVFGVFDVNGFATGSLPVTLHSAATAADLKLKVDFPQAGATPNTVFEPQTVWVERIVNYNLKSSLFTVDNAEQIAATTADWSPTLTEISPGAGEGWRVTSDLNDSYHTGQAWFIPDNDTPTDASLISPVIKVGTQPFSVKFDTAFQFEIDTDDGPGFSFDGGVVEVKIGSGRWQDVLAAGGSFTRGGYNTQVIAFAPNYDVAGACAGFGGFSAGLTPQTISFGTALAGRSVRLRFRAATDSGTGELGWLVDNIRVVGATNLPFSEVVADTATCVNRPPYVRVPAVFSTPERLAGQSDQAIIKLVGSAKDLDGLNGLTYLWTQTSGPAVTLNNAQRPTAYFRAPLVSTDTVMGFELRVSDGTNTRIGSVTVTLLNVD